MSDLTINIQTPSGFEVQGALIPDNITVEQVIAELLGGLSLPRAANGQPINYSLVLVNRGLVLLGDQTLQDCGVQYGDTIRLVTGVEPVNGSQSSRGSDQKRNGGSPGIGDPAWQPAPPPPAPVVAQPVTAPLAPPPVATPAVNNDWPRDAGPVINDDWPLGTGTGSTTDWPRDGGHAANSDWPKDTAPVVTGDWPRDAQASPVFEAAEESSHSFAMAEPATAGADEMKDPALASARFEIDGGWTANELSECLGSLELAYSRLNAFLCLSDEDIIRGASVADSKSGSGSLEGAFGFLVAAGNRRSSGLKVSGIDFDGRGVIELAGEQPPIKIMTEIINGWRQANLAAGNGSRPDKAKPATEAAAALVRRAEQLSGQGRGVFVEGFIYHAIDASREALEALAK